MNKNFETHDVKYRAGRPVETPERVKSLKETSDKVAKVWEKMVKDVSQSMYVAGRALAHTDDSNEFDPNKHYCHMIGMIETLAAEELAAANQRYPLFASSHEAYAVIMEELQEAEEDLNDATELMKKVWRKTRENEDCTHELKVMTHTAIHAAYESIQTAAMCQKAINSEEQRNAKG